MPDDDDTKFYVKICEDMSGIDSNTLLLIARIIDLDQSRDEDTLAAIDTFIDDIEKEQGTYDETKEI